MTFTCIHVDGSGQSRRWGEAKDTLYYNILWMLVYILIININL